MKIVGAHGLNANNYERISIKDNINVKGKNRKDNLIVSDVFTKSLKGLSDQEKRERVIRYYIRNHILSGLYEKDSEVIINTASKLELLVKGEYLINKGLLKEIITKYNIDRMDTYANSDVDYYWFRGNIYAPSMSNTVGVLDDFTHDYNELPKILKGKKCMIMNTGFNHTYKENELNKIEIKPTEVDFFNRMIDDMDEIQYWSCNNEYYRNSMFYRCIKDSKEVFIIIDKELWPFINIMCDKIEKNRKNLVRAKKAQYKMEGF